MRSQLAGRQLNPHQLALDNRCIISMRGYSWPSGQRPLQGSMCVQGNTLTLLESRVGQGVQDSRVAPPPSLLVIPTNKPH